jgi:hypothetical protein
MKLPAAEKAIIAEAKVCEYLLSPEHPVGRSKARFFNALGFNREAWPALRAVLAELALTGDAEPGPVSAFGQKYLVRGTIRGPSGIAAIETVWIVLEGEDLPRLITAYPGDRE